MLQMGNAPSSSSVLNQGKGQLSSSDTLDSRPAFPPAHLSAEPEGKQQGLMRLLGPQRLRIIIVSSYLLQRIWVSKHSRTQIIWLKRWQQPRNLALCVKFSRSKNQIHLEQ